MVDPTKLNDYVRDYIDDKEVGSFLVYAIDTSDYAYRSAPVLASKPFYFLA
jgi:hypothetical protein